MPRASRVCPTPGCPQFQPCPTHVRPNANARGYDAAHRRLRAEWAPRVAAGDVICWRCHEPISPTELWDLGHIDRTAYGGPEHANRCNRAAAGRESHQR